MRKKADDILIDAKYSIIDQEGDLVINHSTEYDPTKYVGWGFARYVTHAKLLDDKLGYLHDGNLILLVELKIKNKNPEIKKEIVKYPNDFMGKMYASLFEDPDRFDADFVIQCKDQKEIRCHRNILAAAFSYFEVS